MGLPGSPRSAPRPRGQAWQNFLKAAVARYGPGGSYWSTKYKQDYGPSATPLPIQSWQIWNEPNLKKYFSPGSTTQQAANKYAQLLAISHDAIKARDPQATVVLAGMPSIPHATGCSNAWDFLNALYNVAGVKADFDAAALHPYGCNLDQTRTGISQFSAVMKNHGDGATPLWLTEFAWGSGAPDQFCKNKGLAGQRDLLVSSFRMILQNRKTWNVQRLFWFLWRDAEPGSNFATYCSFCGTRGAFAPQPHREARLHRLQGLHGRDDPAGGEHHLGAGPGKLHQRLDPELLLCLQRGRLDLRLSLRRGPVHGLLLAHTPGRRRSRTAPTPSR